MLRRGYNNQPGWTPSLVPSRGPNLFTENVATGTDTLGTTEGFYTYQGEEILTSSNEWASQGTKSLKVSIPGTRANEGVFIATWDANPSTNYGFKMKINNPNASNLLVSIYDQGWATMIKSFSITTIGPHTIQTTFSSGESLDAAMIRVVCVDAVETHFYIDDCYIGEI